MHIANPNFSFLEKLALNVIDLHIPKVLHVCLMK